MQIDNMTSLDVALICEGLIRLGQEPDGDRAMQTWIKVANQCMGYEPDETANLFYRTDDGELMFRTVEAAVKSLPDPILSEHSETPGRVTDTDNFKYDSDLFGGERYE